MVQPLQPHAGSLHQRMPASVLEAMVAFVTALHHQVNVEHRFGAAGSPWEFNLRDLLRWTELVEAALPGSTSGYAFII